MYLNHIIQSLGIIQNDLLDLTTDSKRVKYLYFCITFKQHLALKVAGKAENLYLNVIIKNHFLCRR